jgi:hypothetical protein
LALGFNYAQLLIQPIEALWDTKNFLKGLRSKLLKNFLGLTTAQSAVLTIKNRMLKEQTRSEKSEFSYCLSKSVKIHLKFI